jgi:hypothetical protein
MVVPSEAALCPASKEDNLVFLWYLDIDLGHTLHTWSFDHFEFLSIQLDSQDTAQLSFLL